jgi:hypothetical protein
MIRSPFSVSRKTFGSKGGFRSRFRASIRFITAPSLRATSQGPEAADTKLTRLRIIAYQMARRRPVQNCSHSNGYRESVQSFRRIRRSVLPQCILMNFRGFYRQSKRWSIWHSSRLKRAHKWRSTATAKQPAYHLPPFPNSVHVNVSTICRIGFVCAQARIETE